jgi:hypothetical protein
MARRGCCRLLRKKGHRVRPRQLRGNRGLVFPLLELGPPDYSVAVL